MNFLSEIQLLINSTIQYSINFESALLLSISSFFVLFFHYILINIVWRIEISYKALAILTQVIFWFLYFFYNNFVFLFALILFLMVFIIGIPGVIYQYIKKIVHTFFPKERTRAKLLNRHQSQKKRNPNAYARTKVNKSTSNLIVIKIIAILFFVFGFWFAGFFGVIVSMFIFSIIEKKLQQKSNLFHVQKLLPTSKISSLAMGLVEVEGKIITDKLLNTQIKNRPCIGYVYFIQDISTDTDNNKSYKTIYTESAFNPFYIQDNSGRIKVIPDNLDLVRFKMESYESKGKRFCQYVLEPDNQTYLLIGTASNLGGEPIIKFDEFNKILSITNAKNIESYNKREQIFKLVKPYFYIFLLWMAFVLSSKIEYNDNELTFKPDFSFKIPFNFSFFN